MFNLQSLLLLILAVLAFLSTALAQLPAPTLPPSGAGGGAYRMDPCGPGGLSLGNNLGRPCAPSGTRCTAFDDCFAYAAVADVSTSATGCDGVKFGTTIHITNYPLTGITNFLLPQPVGTVVLPVFMVGPHNALQAPLGPTIAEPGHDMLYVDLAAAVLVPAAWLETFPVLTSLTPPTTAFLEAYGVSWPLPVDPATIGLLWDVQMARLLPSGLLYLSSSTTFVIAP